MNSLAFVAVYVQRILVTAIENRYFARLTVFDGAPPCESSGNFNDPSALAAPAADRPMYDTPVADKNDLCIGITRVHVPVSDDVSAKGLRDSERFCG